METTAPSTPDAFWQSIEETDRLNKLAAVRAFYVASRIAEMAPVTEVGREFAQFMAEYDWNLAHGLIDGSYAQAAR